MNKIDKLLDTAEEEWLEAFDQFFCLVTKLECGYVFSVYLITAAWEQVDMEKVERTMRRRQRERLQSILDGGHLEGV